MKKEAKTFFPFLAETIFAVATGAGRSAIAVMRLSGPRSGDMLDRLCRTRPEPKVAALRSLRDMDKNLLDQALVLWFPGPHSFTGEDSAELHLHGGRAVIEGVADALVRLGGRPAEPGEFTRRAFLNGKMDLLTAEAISDLVEAETSAQRTQALRQMDGALGELYRGWSARLLHLLAQQEAMIDFPDEDIPAEVESGIIDEIAALAAEMRSHLDDGGRGERLREGLVFAIIGRPNVGKSTLLNAIAEREVAIVSATPGTTRDVLEARVVLDGIPVTLLDTAGLRESADPIEAEGVRRAKDRAAQADLVIVISDATQPYDPLPGISTEFSADVPMLHVVNKIDAAPAMVVPGNAISARSGHGLDRLRQELADTARRLTAAAGPPPLTRARHRAAVDAACSCMTAAAAAPLPELRGEDLRLALRSLARLTGEVGVEDLLDSVFRQFCIGK